MKSAKNENNVCRSSSFVVGVFRNVQPQLSALQSFKISKQCGRMNGGFFHAKCPKAKEWKRNWSAAPTKTKAAVANEITLTDG